MRVKCLELPSVIEVFGVAQRICIFIAGMLKILQLLVSAREAVISSQSRCISGSSVASIK